MSRTGSGAAIGPVATVAMLLLGGAAWWLGGVAAPAIGLEELDPILRLCLVFAALGGAERLFAGWPGSRINNGA